MEVFDAVCHSFSTVAIGGFSTHDGSIGHFKNQWIESIAIVFMLISGLNFSLHFMAWRYGRISHYWQDPESKAYATVLGIFAVAVIGFLVITRQYSTFGQAFSKGLFQVVSIGTTTGFTTEDYANQWAPAIPVMLILASFVGGCAGSTGGGMKVIRWLLIYKQGIREIIRLVHPNAEIPVKLGGKAVPFRVVDSVWGFFSIYVVVFGVMMLLIMGTGLDQVTAFSAIAASLNNLGPALGEAANDFQDIPDGAKWISIFAMLLGRLEIFTLLVLFTPTFWQR
jgi:trk system potassium uptake protein TrkH